MYNFMASQSKSQSNLFFLSQLVVCFCCPKISSFSFGHKQTSKAWLILSLVERCRSFDVTFATQRAGFLIIGLKVVGFCRIEKKALDFAFNCIWVRGREISQMRQLHLERNMNYLGHFSLSVFSTIAPNVKCHWKSTSNIAFIFISLQRKQPSGRKRNRAKKELWRWHKAMRVMNAQCQGY